MKNTFLSFVFLVYCFVAKGQSEFLGLTSIDHGHARISYYETSKRAPSNFKATATGGSIDTYLKLNNGCTEKYRFIWSFDRDVSKIKIGDIINGTLKAILLSGNCHNNSAYITASGSNNGSSMINKKRKAEGGLKVRNNRAYAAGYDHLPRSTGFTLEIGYSSVPDASFFTVKIGSTTDASNDDVFDYEIRYNYKKNATINTGGTINCNALYGLGVNIGMLEYGALKNDSPTFLVGFIDNAILSIKGAGCLDTQYLKDLKYRMSSAINSNPYYNEISNYRQSLAKTMIPGKCK